MLAVCGCTSQSYAGIDLRPGAAPSELQALAVQAHAGDKQAQFELGTRFENGEGVSRDMAKAKVLYRRAASDGGGPLQVYSPPVSGSDTGRIVTIDQGPRTSGLLKAKERLAALRAASPSGSSDLMQNGGQWHEFPWDPAQVFNVILDNVDSGGLDPESIAAKIDSEGSRKDSAVVTTLYKSTPYSCADNPARIPSAYLSQVCAERVIIREHVYSSGEPKNIESNRGRSIVSAYTGEFLRSAPGRNIRLVDLNTDREFNESRSVGHIGFPLSATLVLSPNKNRLVLIYATTGDAVAGDKIMSIAIYSIG